MPDFSQADLDAVVENISEIGDLSYLLAPDPNPVGIQQRLRIQTVKHLLHADPPPVPPAPPAPGPMPTIMYDSTTALDIPASAAVVAGYADGLYRWSDLDWQRFPNARHVTISAIGQIAADWWDVETGDLTAAQGMALVGQHPGSGIYIERSRLGEITIDCPLWVADWTGQAHMLAMPGRTIAAVQFADPLTSGGHYDLSLLAA